MCFFYHLLPLLHDASLFTSSFGRKCSVKEISILSIIQLSFTGEHGWLRRWMGAKNNIFIFVMWNKFFDSVIIKFISISGLFLSFNSLSLMKHIFHEQPASFPHMHFLICVSAHIFRANLYLCKFMEKILLPYISFNCMCKDYCNWLTRSTTFWHPITANWLANCS